MDINKYLNEKSKIDLSAHVMNRVNDAIEEWKKLNLNKFGEWPTREKDLYKLASDMIDYFNGMKRVNK